MEASSISSFLDAFRGVTLALEPAPLSGAFLERMELGRVVGSLLGRGIVVIVSKSSARLSKESDSRSGTQQMPQNILEVASTSFSWGTVIISSTCAAVGLALRSTRTICSAHTSVCLCLWCPVVVNFWMSCVVASWLAWKRVPLE